MSRDEAAAAPDPTHELEEVDRRETPDMTDLPDPLVPPDVDLRDFPFMPLDVVRLRDSSIAAVDDPEVFRAAVLSWCLAWHQVPAASLPDDDRLLARMIGFGRDIETWKRVRSAGGLHGWIKCSDGRLYHPVVAEKALEAVAFKRTQSNRGAAGAKARWHRHAAGNATALHEHSSGNATANAQALHEHHASNAGADACANASATAQAMLADGNGQDRTGHRQDLKAPASLEPSPRVRARSKIDAEIDEIIDQFDAIAAEVHGARDPFPADRSVDRVLIARWLGAGWTAVQLAVLFRDTQERRKADGKSAIENVRYFERKIASMDVGSAPGATPKQDLERRKRAYIARLSLWNAAGKPDGYKPKHEDYGVYLRDGDWALYERLGPLPSEPPIPVEGGQGPPVAA